MIKKIELFDEELKRYIYSEPYFNTYMISDIEKFGINSDVISLFAGISNNKIYCVIMKYGTSFVVFSENPCDINVLEVREFFDNYKYNITITGKKEVADIVRQGLSSPLISDYSYSILKKDKLNLFENNEEDFKIIKDCSVDEIIDIYSNIDEYSHKYSDYRLSKKRIMMNNLNGRYYGIEHVGKIVSIVCSAAESNSMAMISEVGTLKSYRGKGLSKIIVSNLCKDLFEEGKNILTIFYSDYIAGHVYERIGFENIGYYSMIKHSY